MTLRAVFLDVGNTLLREEPPRFELYARAARARGLAVDAERMTELMRRAHRELPQRLDGAFRYSDPWFEAFIGRIFGSYLGLAPDALPALRRELFDVFEDPATFRLFPGALELLGELGARGIVRGAISNWSARLPRVLEVTGLAPGLDLVVCSALEGAEKPDPRLFELALERAGTSADDAVHAGDHPRRDVEGARRAGLRAILVDHSGTIPRGDAPLVRSLPELQSLLLEGRGAPEAP